MPEPAADMRKRAKNVEEYYRPGRFGAPRGRTNEPNNGNEGDEDDEGDEGDEGDQDFYYDDGYF